MSSLLKKVVAVAVMAACTAPALAADLIEPVPVEQAPVYEAPQYGSWYIRGDVDYHKPDFRGADYITYGPGTKSFDSGELKGAFSLGGGVGYQVTNYLRTDLTFDKWFKSDFTGHTSCDDCASTDTSNLSALLLLANAYVDLGTYKGITPYIGAGIGGARVKWDDLHNNIDGFDTIHKGTENWRFAYAVMAGASYCLTDNLALDAGYRFSHIQGGRMFEFNGAGPGFDKGFNTHEVRTGLRYSFGGGANGCSQPQSVSYEPVQEPVYK